MRSVFATAVIAGALAVLGGTATASADTRQDEHLVLFSEHNGQGADVGAPIAPGECVALEDAFDAQSADNAASPFDVVLYGTPNCSLLKGPVVPAGEKVNLERPFRTWSVRFVESDQ